jgi:hypothetical protein
LLARASLADTVDVQGVRQGTEPVPTANLFLEFLDPFLDELEDLAACDADHVLVMIATDRRFEQRVAVTEVVLAKQAGIDQMSDRPVDRCTGDVGAGGAQGFEEPVGVEVTVQADDALEDVATLRGHPDAALPKTILEEL